VGVTANASLTEEELVGAAGERELLEGFLEYHRRVVSGKLHGLPEEAARRPLVPSSTTPIGLVKHAPLTAVAARTGVSREMVRKWRVRFVEGRMEGLADAPRPGASAAWPVAVTRDVSPASTVRACHSAFAGRQLS
jgi:hypothetical protein